MWSKLLVLCTILLHLFQYSESYFVVVDAHSEECFFDRVDAGTKMGESIDCMLLTDQNRSKSCLSANARCYV